MKTYRVDFKPISPYFFGNEKTFSYRGQKIGQKLSNQYYIKSERMPSQTTVLGALRYLFLAHKNHDYIYTEKEFSENAVRVGAESFDIGRSEAQDFGVIQKISPVFLYHKEKGVLIPTPFDHNEATESETYAPFRAYGIAETSEGKKLYAEDYDAKTGLTDSFTALDTGRIVPNGEIFDGEDRVGIAIGAEEKGFFKKKYAMLKKNYSFSVYLTLTDDGAVDALRRAEGGAVSVFMGQGKSAFLVSFTEEENETEPKISSLLQRKLPICGNLIYFMGDTVLSDAGTLYEKTLFSALKTKDYRAFGIVYEDGAGKEKIGKFQKKEILYKLIAAGSVVIASDAEDVLRLTENPNAQKIGLNQVIKG